ncbi:MAG: hypothetical protein KDB07_09840 [Planctomycetes bacterium]|nr:hypothetical protein [Planctomycetota bacterium]
MLGKRAFILIAASIVLCFGSSVSADEVDLKGTLKVDAERFIELIADRVVAPRAKSYLEFNKLSAPDAKALGLFNWDILPLTLWKTEKGLRNYKWVKAYDKSKKEFEIVDVIHTPSHGWEQLKTTRTKLEIDAFQKHFDGDSFMTQISMFNEKEPIIGADAIRCYAAFLLLNQYEWPAKRAYAFLAGKHEEYRGPVESLLLSTYDWPDAAQIRLHFVGAKFEGQAEEKPDNKSKGRNSWYLALPIEADGVSAERDKAARAWEERAQADVNELLRDYERFRVWTSKSTVRIEQLVSDKKGTRARHSFGSVLTLKQLFAEVHAATVRFDGASFLEKAQKAHAAKKEDKDRKKRKPSVEELLNTKAPSLYDIHTILETVDELVQERFDAYASKVETIESSVRNSEMVAVYTQALESLDEFLPSRVGETSRKKGYAVLLAYPWHLREIAERYHFASVPADFHKMVNNKSFNSTGLLYISAYLSYYPNNPHGRIAKAMMLMPDGHPEDARELLQGILDDENINEKNIKEADKLKKNAKTYLEWLDTKWR